MVSPIRSVRARRIGRFGQPRHRISHAALTLAKKGSRTLSAGSAICRYAAAATMTAAHISPTGVSSGRRTKARPARRPWNPRACVRVVARNIRRRFSCRYSAMAATGSLSALPSFWLSPCREACDDKATVPLRRLGDLFGGFALAAFFAGAFAGLALRFQWPNQDSKVPSLRRNRRPKVKASSGFFFTRRTREICAILPEAERMWVSSFSLSCL